MDAIEKEAAGGGLEKKGGNLFGQSITKELLAQSRKEIANDLGPEEDKSSDNDKFEKKGGNMFGQSITKELLAQSRKEIANDLGPEEDKSSDNDKFDFHNDHEKY